MSKETQQSKILRYVEEHGSISPWEAQSRLRIMRLAARIRELENSGYKFEHVWIANRDEDGSITRYMRYRMVV